MEMQEIPKEKEKSKEEDEGAGEPMLEVKIEEEAEPDHYSKLQTPYDDIYSEALPSDAPAKTTPGKEQTEGNARLYRVACLFLTLICIVLLVVVIILSQKHYGSLQILAEQNQKDDRHTVQTIPADQEVRTFAPACTIDHCRARFPTIYIKNIGCKQCADGWLTYGRSCFFLSTFRLRWSESQQNCTARGGSLAVITSKEMQDFLTKKGNLQYWIGTSQNGTEWTWVDNTELQESYWAENPQNGNCGILDSTGPADKNWFRASCHVATYFICQLQF